MRACTKYVFLFTVVLTNFITSLAIAFLLVPLVLIRLFFQIVKPTEILQENHLP
jgi:hypothetical protein